MMSVNELKMSEKVAESVLETVKRYLLKPGTLVVLLLLVSFQIFVLFITNHSSNSESSAHQRRHFFREGNTTLKPIKLDEIKFEIKVMKHHKDMLKKFPVHPDMILKKMRQELEKEVNKTTQLYNDVELLRDTLGIKQVTIETPPDALVQKRIKRDASEIEICPEKSPLLVGPVFVKTEGIADSNPESEEFKSWFGTRLRPGGAYKPENCIARQKVAIIIPFRDRQSHLKVFLHHLHPVLQRQQLDYRIFVIEQDLGYEFNRAALMNVGFSEAMKLYDFDCFIFHDVDLLPEDDRNLYLCPGDNPKHMSVAVNKWKYRLQYLEYLGGVTALSTHEFKKINGFANSFYGWGGEDDDFDHRVKEENLKIVRSPAHVGRFFMQKHDKVDMNEDLTEMMEKSEKNLLKDDGLSTLKYEKVDENNFPLFTWIKVQLPPPPYKKKKNVLKGIGGALWSGMSMLTGGISKKISDSAVSMAARNEEIEDSKRNHIY